MDYMNFAWQALAKNLSEFTVQIEKLQNKLKNDIDIKNKKEFKVGFDSNAEISKLKEIEETLSGINNVY